MIFLCLFQILCSYLPVIDRWRIIYFGNDAIIINVHEIIKLSNK